MAKKASDTAKKKSAAARSKEDMLESIYDKMETAYSIKKELIPNILRETAFKSEREDKPATESEMISLLSVAEKYGLNPFIREIFAFRNKKGVLCPIVSVDGWIKIMNSQKDFEGFEFTYSEKMSKIGKSKACFDWIEVVIHVKDRKYPITAREYLDECYVARSYTSPWDTHTKRMLRHKALSQGIRIAFGVNDVHDQDEILRIDDSLEEEIKRESELEKPETAESIPTDPEPVEAVPSDTIEPKPDKPAEPAMSESVEPEKKIDQEDNVVIFGQDGEVVETKKMTDFLQEGDETPDPDQVDIFTDGKTDAPPAAAETSEPAADDVPDLF